MPTVDPAISHLLALALAAIFLGSSALKFSDLGMFAGAAANYRLLPRWLERPAAWVIPIAEGSCALSVLLDATRTAAAAGLGVLLGVFSAAIAINLMRGRRHIDCGCFGPAIRQELSGWLLLRNFALMMVAGLAALPVGGRALNWLDGVTIGLGAASVAILYMSANYAIGNLAPTRALRAL